MKKTFTILIAALAAILMMAQPMKVMGQTKDATTLAAWVFTSTNCPSVNSDMNATTGLCSSSTFNLVKASSPGWKSERSALKFQRDNNSEVEILITLTLDRALSIGEEIEFSLYTWYNKASNASINSSLNF